MTRNAGRKRDSLNRVLQAACPWGGEGVELLMRMRDPVL